MILVANLGIALAALRVHRLRSALAMLGIVIGVAAVVTMTAIAAGAEARIAAEIRSLGANLVAISPGSVTSGGARLGSGASPRLSEDDAAALASELPALVAVAPVITARAQFAAGAANWAGQVKGVTEAYFRAREWAVAEGRGIETADLERAAKVVLLGATLRATLFPDADPVGAVIRVRDVPFTVIGVLERKGQSLQGDDQDDIAFAPLTTVRRQLVGVNRASPRAIYYMLAKFADDVEVSGLLDEMRRVLRQRHRIAAGQEDSFALSNLAEVAEKQAAARRVLGVLLAAIASISLVVGGIGVMNVMLVSVTERTREIGLRMAVGARRRDILLQFLTEAATLAGLGGVVGTLSGVLAAAMIAAIAGWPVLVDPATVLLAVASSAAIGVFFGWYPARKAARLAPIEALRHE